MMSSFFLFSDWLAQSYANGNHGGDARRGRCLDIIERAHFQGGLFEKVDNMRTTLLPGWLVSTRIYFHFQQRQQL